MSCSVPFSTNIIGCHICHSRNHRNNFFFVLIHRLGHVIRKIVQQVQVVLQGIYHCSCVGSNTRTLDLRGSLHRFLLLFTAPADTLGDFVPSSSTYILDTRQKLWLTRRHLLHNLNSDIITVLQVAQKFRGIVNLDFRCCRVLSFLYFVHQRRYFWYCQVRIVKF